MLCLYAHVLFATDRFKGLGGMLGSDQDKDKDKDGLGPPRRASSLGRSESQGRGGGSSLTRPSAVSATNFVLGGKDRDRDGGGGGLALGRPLVVSFRPPLPPPALLPEEVLCSEWALCTVRECARDDDAIMSFEIISPTLPRPIRLQVCR